MQEKQETWVPSSAWKDPLEEGTATHSSILARRIPARTEEPGGLQSTGSQRVNMTKRLTLSCMVLAWRSVIRLKIRSAGATTEDLLGLEGATYKVVNQGLLLAGSLSS